MHLTPTCAELQMQHLAEWYWQRTANLQPQPCSAIHTDTMILFAMQQHSVLRYCQHKQHTVYRTVPSMTAQLSGRVVLQSHTSTLLDS
jgi:hypothetical protein